jgi:hypothetical protein
MGGAVKAVTSVVNAVVNVVSSVVNAVVNVVADVVNFVASPFMGMLGMGAPDLPGAAAEAQRQDGVLIQKNGGGAVAIPVVYGYRKLGGVVTFCETGSTNNKYLWTAYSFCEGLVEGINEIWLDDVQLSASIVANLNAGNIVDVADSKFAGRVKLQWFPGVFFSNPASSNIGTTSILAEAPSWKSTMVYNGVAVLMVRYEWKAITTQAEADANPFSGNIPQIQLSILGKRVASLRTGAGTENSSYGGAGYIERYSTNPAECLLDYLRNPRYGKGLANTDIDWTSFYVAAQKCNQEISYTSSVKGPILTMNMVIDTNQSLFQTTKALLQNFRAYLPYVQGKYKLKIEDAGNATDILSGAADIAAVFNRDNIIGSITYTGIDRTSKYNQVVVTYVDPDQKFSTQQVVYPENEAERQIYIDFDGGRENKSEVTFSGITNQQIARDMARLIFNKSRFQESCSLTVDASAFNLEPGDNIHIQSNVLNFGTVPWRIVSIKLSNNYTFDLGCVRNPDFIYPYVIPNTPDRVVAPYIPQGASILPPRSGGQTLIGLVPPVTAPITPIIGIVNVTTGTITNPPTTVTTGTNGGGVGGSTSTVNINGGSLPPPPALVTNLTDVVNINSLFLTRGSVENSAAIDFTFFQPQNAMYGGVIVYFKPSNSSVWANINIDDRPGPGQAIRYRLNNLLTTSSSVYNIRIRVKYTTGQFSERITVLDQPTYTQLLGITLDPNDYAVNVTQGWLDALAGVAFRNTAIGQVDGRTDFLADPRTLDFQVQQRLDLDAINPDIQGIRIYYKPSGESYWDFQSFLFENYIPGGFSQSFKLTGLGARGTAQFYDFILRFVFNDGTESSIQRRYVGCPIETFRGSPSITLGDGGVIFVSEPSTIVPVVTKQLVPTGAIADVRNTKIGIYAVRFSTLGGAQATFHLLPPEDTTAANNWLGVNVYYRKAIPGTNPAFTKATFKGLSTGEYEPGITTRSFRLALDADQPYQIVIVPLMLYNGAEVEARFSLKGQGSIHADNTRRDFPLSTLNWIGAYNFIQGDTSLLLNSLKEGFVEPVVVVNRWRLHNLSAPFNTVVNDTIPYYFELVFDVGHIPSFEEAIILRRAKAPGRTNTAPFFGLGRWERITLTTAISGGRYNATTKQFSLKLKLPISHEEFSSLPTATTSTGLLNLFPPSPFKRIDPITTIEIYIQVKSAGVLSNRIIQLYGYQATVAPVIDMLSLTGALESQITTLETATYPAAGWQRRISEARTATNATIISRPNIYYFGQSLSNTNIDFTDGAI